MRVEVTEEDIRRGIGNNCHFCPVALALGRTAGIAHGFNGAISVRHDAISVLGGAVPLWPVSSGVSARACLRWDTPPEVENFLHDFDEGLTVLPFAFDLEGENGAARLRELRAALDNEDGALRRPATMQNVFLADALVQSRELAERALWEWAGWKGEPDAADF